MLHCGSRRNQLEGNANNMRNGNIKTLLALHLLLMVYSVSGICSKLAANQSFLSLKFCIYYIAIIALLGFYAVGWQQIIKRLPLTTAFSNKAITVVWGIIWGKLFFEELVTPKNLLGAVMIVTGIILYAHEEHKTLD